MSKFNIDDKVKIIKVFDFEIVKIGETHQVWDVGDDYVLLQNGGTVLDEQIELVIPTPVIQVGIKLLTETAQIPIQANLSDVGRDLYTDEDIYIKAGQTVVIPTGIALDLPVGYFADVRSRSSVTSKTKLRVHLGTIDAGFKGNIGIICENTDSEGTFVYKNTKLAQLVIQKMPDVELVEVKELSDSQRGIGGFGSTDKEG